MPIYNVHLFPVVRVKVSGIEADSQIEAIEKAEQGVSYESMFNYIGRPAGLEVEYVDDHADGYLVDEVDDEEFENSQFYRAKGDSFVIDHSQPGALDKLIDAAKEALRDIRTLTARLEDEGQDTGDFSITENLLEAALKQAGEEVTTPEAQEPPVKQEDRFSEYIRQGGVKCPFCGSDDIEGGFVETNEGGAEQPMHCNACHERWTDIYRLEGAESA